MGTVAMPYKQNLMLIAVLTLHINLQNFIIPLPYAD